jgi:WD40 repeat protein
VVTAVNRPGLLSALGNRPAGGVFSVAFSPNSQRLVSGSEDGTIQVWDWEKKRRVHSLKAHTSRGSGVVFPPDGKRLATASWDGTAKLWNIETGLQGSTLRGSGRLTALVFSAAGDRLAAASDEGTVRVWQPSTGQHTLFLKAHTGWIAGVSFSPDGKRLASASVDATVKVWHAERGQDPLLLRVHDRDRTAPRTLAFSPDGGHLAAADDLSWPRIIKVWNLTTGSVTQRLPVDGVVATGGLCFSHDGKQLVAVLFNGLVQRWDTRTGKKESIPAKNTKPSQQEIRFADIDAARRRLACVYCELTTANQLGPGELEIQDLDARRTLLTLGQPGSLVIAVAFSPDGKLLATGSLDGTVQLRDASTGRELFTFGSEAVLRMRLAFSPDGQSLAVTSNQGATLWDTNTGKRRLSLKNQGIEETAIAFSSDGKRLACGGWDGAVRLWDVETGQEILTLHGYDEFVTALVFSADGRWLAGGCVNGTIKVWEATPPDQPLTPQGIEGR